MSPFPLVIIVDDERLDRYIVRRELSRAAMADGFAEFESAEELLESLDRVARDTAELPEPRVVPVLVDLNMPGMGGFELMERLSGEVGKLDWVPKLVVLTSSSSPADLERARSSKHVRAFVTKRAGLPELIDALEEISGEATASA